MAASLSGSATGAACRMYFNGDRFMALHSDSKGAD